MKPIPPVIDMYVAGLKTHDVVQIAGAFSEELEFISPVAVLNKPQFLAMLTALYAGFPDWSYEHDAPCLDGDQVAICWRQAGIHTGVFALPGLKPIAPTQRRVQIPDQTFFYRVRDNQIVQIRPDPIPGGAPSGILQQIGIATPPV